MAFVNLTEEIRFHISQYSMASSVQQMLLGSLQAGYESAGLSWLFVPTFWHLKLYNIFINHHANSKM